MEACGGYPKAELQQLLASTCLPVMQQRADKAQELLEHTNLFLEQQAASWGTDVTAVAHLCHQLAQLHCRHKDGSEASERSLRQTLDNLRQVGR